MKRPAFVITTTTGSKICGKCRAPLINPFFPNELPDSCPSCGRELDYSAYMIKSKLTEIKRKKVETK